MYFTIYKITNKANGTIYIGKHQTNNLDDGYMGSGKLITSAIKKYGRDAFVKEILFVFDNEADMNIKEAELVTEEFVSKSSNYNLCPGGYGGFGYINSNGIPKFKGKSHTEETKQRIKESRKGYRHTDDIRQKISDANTLTNESRGRKTSAALTGKQKTEEHRLKISQSLTGKPKRYPKTRKSRSPIQHATKTCPYCNKTGGSNVMQRWHFDNCKQNPSPAPIKDDEC